MLRSDPSRPSVSVVIATRDRPAELLRCLESVRQLDYPAWEVVVVDQSDNDCAQRLAERFKDSGLRLRCLRTAERGLSRARNAGVSLARGEVVTFLDDDCTVPPNWLVAIADTLDRFPQAGLVFGTVRSALPHVECYVPSYLVPAERMFQSVLGALRAHGIGASMCLRREVLERVGPFDVQLGAGSRFLSSEDWDYTFRVLAAGMAVVETPAILVDHYGCRPYEGGEAALLLRGNAFSHGALHMKLLKCGHLASLLLIAAEVGATLKTFRPLAPLLRRGPSNLGRLLMYGAGLVVASAAPVDRRRQVYADRQA